MEARNLPPEREHVGYAYSEVRLAELLRQVMGDAGFTHMEVVRGNPYTTRLLLIKENPDIPDAVPLPSPQSHRKMGVALRNQALKEARYSPAFAPDGMIKGWQIEKLSIRGELVMLASAAWLSSE